MTEEHLQELAPRSIRRELIIMVFVYALLAFVFYLLPSLELLLFVQPTGMISAFFSGGVITHHSDWSWSFIIQGLFIQVDQTCSGTNFFCLMTAFFLSRPFKNSRQFLILLFLAYPLTIFANICRVLGTTHLHLVIAPFLPARFYSGLHLGLGIMIFLTVLLISSFTCNRVLQVGKHV